MQIIRMKYYGLPQNLNLYKILHYKNLVLYGKQKILYATVILTCVRSLLLTNLVLLGPLSCFALL